MAEYLRKSAASDAGQLKPSDPVSAGIPGVRVSDHNLRDEQYVVTRDKGSDLWFITYTVGGSGIYAIDGTEFVCEPYDVVLVSPNIPRQYRTGPNGHWEFHWASFWPKQEWFSTIKLPPYEHHCYRIRIRDEARREQAERAFSILHYEQHQNGFHSRMLMLNALETLLILLGQEYENIRRPERDSRIETILEYFAGNLHQPLDLTQLAALVNLSPSRISHLFKSQTGRPLASTFLGMRLQHAANLLQYTAQPVQQIADNTGFSSIYSFSTAFKKAYHMSPSDYRKQKFR